MFSDRTTWDLRPNPLARAVAARRASGLELLDLTTSNPTTAGLPAPEGVLEAVRARLSRKGTREGPAEAGWVVLDFGGVVVHLFAPDQRSYYRLEELWNQGKVLLHLQ